MSYDAKKEVTHKFLLFLSDDGNLSAEVDISKMVRDLDLFHIKVFVVNFL